jgi:uncharacterized protein YkwD
MRGPQPLKACVRCIAGGARLWLGAAALLVFAPGLRADPVAVLNALRAEGCGAEPPAGTPLRPNAALDGVARALSGKRSLEQALEGSDYPVSSSTSLHVKGSREDAAIERILEANYCTAINADRFADVGVFQQRDETWIVLGARELRPPPLVPAAVAARVLELVNAARAQARRCGNDRYAAAPPVTLAAALSGAAIAHAHDMAAHGSLSHRGSDGSDSGERITRAGYTWRASGENVAAGQQGAESVVAGWLGSPGHCATLMNPHFTEMGIAFALAPGKNPGIYWAQVFASPR